MHIERVHEEAAARRRFGVGEVPVPDREEHKRAVEARMRTRVFRDVRADMAVIEVWDQGGGLPVVGPEGLGATSGRGLLLMSQLVHDWGTRPITEGGKIVWARCAL